MTVTENTNKNLSKFFITFWQFFQTHWRFYDFMIWFQFHKIGIRNEVSKTMSKIHNVCQRVVINLCSIMR